MLRLAVFLVAGCALSGCGDSCREYSDHTCKELERQTYNVYFRFPDSEQDVAIGPAFGLTACGDVARQYAFSKKVADADWSYICCLQTKDSSCAEKHR